MQPGCLLAALIYGPLNLHEDAAERWVVSGRRPPSTVVNGAKKWRRYHDDCGPRYPDPGRARARAGDEARARTFGHSPSGRAWRRRGARLARARVPERWPGGARADRLAVPAALVWGGHVRYGYWHVAVAHRLDLPSAPTVSCHGEHSPDTRRARIWCAARSEGADGPRDLRLGPGVILQRGGGSGGHPGPSRAAATAGTGEGPDGEHTPHGRGPRARERRGRRADTTGLRVDL